MVLGDNMFEHKKIFILGFARSGYEAAKLLVDRGNTVLLNDAKDEKSQNQEQLKELKEKGVEFVLGSHPDEILDDSFDYLIKNPGVPIDHKYVLKAKSLNIPVINEVEMAYQLLPDDVTLIGITGTNGKTTTTTMIYEIIKASGKNVHLTGNIGYPLCSFITKIRTNDIIVMEVSCQQLENLETFKPDIAVMTNLSPAHIDFLKSYENYKRVKAKIFQNHTKDNIAVLNIENPDVLEVTKNIKSTTKYFSSKNEINGCYIKNECIYYYDDKVLELEKIKVSGVHNYENIMAAIMVVKELGIENDIIERVIYNFKGVEHRLEYVKDYNGRIFYNDSKATNNKSTQIALSAFDKPTVLIMGGLDRNQDFTELTPYMKNVKKVVCYGENKQKVKDYMDSIKVDTVVLENLVDATKEAYNSSSEGDVILLSPATASWDQYKCFEDRGMEYKKTVEGICNEN